VSGGGPRSEGSLALVLHSHMPYVEGFDTWPFGEEWLWEAVATVYLPLLELLEEARAPLTVGLTPVLCDQLETLPGPAGERLLAFLGDTRRTVHREDAEGLQRGGEPRLAAEVRRAAGDYERAADALERRDRDLLGGFARLASETPVELMTSAATHALLPLLASDAGLALQLATAVASHERRFGAFGGDLWLPECAYVPGLERGLVGHGARAICVDQTAAWGLGAPDHLDPVLTPAGIVAAPIDWQTVQLVWSARSGYPADAAYRDYHRRTVHDLRPWCNGGGPYSPAAAHARAHDHARDFVGRCRVRLAEHARERRRPGLLCCALDTELLGHWWYEGQAWLAAVIAEAQLQGLELTTLSEGIARSEPVQRPLAPSSWGAAKDFSTWDSPRVAALAFAARAAELRTVAAAQGAGGDGPPSADPTRRPALERAARELLAIQASDWAFQVSGGLAGDYPRRRVAAHAADHAAALAALGERPYDDNPGEPARHAGDPVGPAVRGLAPDLDLTALTAP
jgi:1,4-alpha-glucan branching enzyme